MKPRLRRSSAEPSGFFFEKTVQKTADPIAASRMMPAETQKDTTVFMPIAATTRLTRATGTNTAKSVRQREVFLSSVRIPPSENILTASPNPTQKNSMPKL